jgi:hypothetical protein
MKRHPTTQKKMAPTQSNIPLTPGDIDDPEKLILFAQKHFATRFPNERRVCCPAPGVIRSARADLPPGDELRVHLFSCSECFNEYNAAMRDHYGRTASDEAAADRRRKWIDAPSKWRLPVFAAAVTSLLLAAGLFIQRRPQTASPQSSQNRSQPAPEASAGNPLTPMPRAPTTEQPPDSIREEPRPAGSLAINLDLNRYKSLGDSTRGGSLRERKEEKKIKLPARRAILKLRLRKGSRAGFYRISVVDPDSNRLTETTARCRDGKSIYTVLDLRRAAGMAHRLRVERGDDLNEYLIEIAIP